MTETIVIAGAGHAAGQTIVSLRQGGYAGKLILVGEEPYLPYQRPPLSKKFLAGELDVPRLLVRQQKFYTEHDVDVRLSTRVTAIDRKARAATLSTGVSVPWNKLVIATGSRVRKISLPGAELAGVHYLRNIEDVDRIRDDFRSGAKLVIVGAGYIGLEVAAVAVTRGLDVTVVELAERVMARGGAPLISDFFTRVHQQAGVDIRCNTGIQSFNGTARVQGVTLSDGSEIPADLVIVGIGIVPAVEPLIAAGAEGGNGVLVDRLCRTSLPDIYAIGDCAAHVNDFAEGATIRLESVQNANDQANVVARGICGDEAPYHAIPWFWSNQYDLKLQTAGLSAGHDQTVLRGDVASRSFSVLYLKGGKVIAIDCVNATKDYVQGRMIVTARLAATAEQLADAETPLKALLPS